MCGPTEPDCYGYNSSLASHICNFCKKEVNSKELYEIARPLGKHGRYYYVFLCDNCFKPFKKERMR